MKTNKTIRYSIFAILAGIFWGSMGVFVRLLTNYGLTSVQITAIRFTVGEIFIALFMLIYDKSLFKISLKGFLICAAIGIFSCFCMSTLYFVAMNETSLSVAAILLYTAPVWVVIASVVLYRERFDRIKCISLILAVIGCVCVSGISLEKVSVIGILCGLIAGFAYALYSILGKYALVHCRPITMTFYSFLVATAAAVLTCGVNDVVNVFCESFSPLLLFGFLGTGFFTMTVAFVLYTIGLSKLPAGYASVLATVEPMAATIFGIVFFNEIPTIIGFLGIAMIFAAVIILGLHKESK